MKRHDLDLASLLGGLVFLGIGIIYLLSEMADWDVDGRWIVPIVLIGLGTAGLAASLTWARRPAEVRGSSAATAAVPENKVEAEEDRAEPRD